jgi:hypothetical protein
MCVGVTPSVCTPSFANAALKDDQGVLIKHGSYQWDYTNPVGVGLLRR